VKPDRRRMKKDKAKKKVEDTSFFEREKYILIKSKTLMAQQLEAKITVAAKKTTRQGGKNFAGMRLAHWKLGRPVRTL
jgi:hypothetical protein